VDGGTLPLGANLFHSVLGKLNVDLRSFLGFLVHPLLRIIQGGALQDIFGHKI
jgi:hypothetical protein